MKARCPEMVGSFHGGTYQCQRAAGHLGAHSPTRDDPNSIETPFERQQLTDVDLSDGHIAGGLVIMAAVLPVPELGPKPALVYRFANPDGSGFYPPMVLVVDEDQMVKLAQLTASATAAAVAQASTLGAGG